MMGVRAKRSSPILLKSDKRLCDIPANYAIFAKSGSLVPQQANKDRPHMPPRYAPSNTPRYAPSNRSAGRALPVTAASSRPEGSAIVFQELTAKVQAQKKVRPFDLTLKRRLPTLPRENRSTIGVSELNFSVRNGKRWNLTAITT